MGREGGKFIRLIKKATGKTEFILKKINMLMENQLKVRASDQSILEEEEIILLVLKRQVSRQMSSFLPLAKSWC